MVEGKERKTQESGCKTHPKLTPLGNTYPVVSAGPVSWCKCSCIKDPNVIEQKGSFLLIPWEMSTKILLKKIKPMLSHMNLFKI